MFKVGDVVRVKDTGTTRDGRTGTVVEVRDEPETWNIDVRIEDDEIAFAAEELELVFGTFAEAGYVSATNVPLLEGGYLVFRESAPIQVGDEVTHRHLNWSGVILSLDADKALVRWGANAPSSWEKIGDLIRQQPWKVGDEVTVFNTVSKPEHYIKGLPEGVEVIDIIRAQDADYLHGNVIKYILRWKYKNGVEDLKKAQQYLTWLIEAQESVLPEWRDGTDD